MTPTNTSQSLAGNILNDMRHVLPLTAAALLITAAVAMFMTGVDDIVSVIGSSVAVLAATCAALFLTFSRREVAAALQMTVARGIQRGTSPSEMITMITMISDLSRRVGLVGLVDIRTSSPELREVCALVAGACDESVIRMQLDKRRRTEKAAHAMVSAVLFFTALYATLTGVLGSVLQYARSQAVDVVVPASGSVAMLPLISGLALGLFAVVLLGRVRLAHMRELVSLEIAYSGGAMILEDNNAAHVRRRLTELLPPGMEK
ncbi:hypothetical protein Q4485_10065 [Granulosicoccaceae sp. 1_MG-2023]|nr:hypothetical protein [Granulosicoccaceae sp. 1_MG-2023]